MGVTFMQQQDRTDPKTWDTIEFWIKAFTETDRRYRSMERKFLSVVWFLRTLRPYIDGTYFS